MFPTRAGAVIAACLVVLVGGWFGWRWLQPDVSGVYVATGPNLIWFLQLVETPNHHLTGRFEESALKPDGTIQRITAPVTGDVNGKNIVMTLRPLAPLPIDVTASGTINFGQISLILGAWGYSGQSTFEKSDMAAFQTKLADLNARSRTLLAAQAAAQARQREAEARQRVAETQSKQVAEMRQFLTQAATIKTAFNDRMKSFPEWEQRYQAITDKMRAYLEREQQIPIDWRSAPARSQLSVTIGQGPIASDQMHIEIETHHQALETTRGNLARSFDTLRQMCRLAHENTPANPIPPDQFEWNETCLLALAAEPNLNAQADKLAAGYQHVEAVYQQEMARQKQIEEAANRAAS